VTMRRVWGKVALVRRTSQRKHRQKGGRDFCRNLPIPATTREGRWSTACGASTRDAAVALTCHKAAHYVLLGSSPSVPAISQLAWEETSLKRTPLQRKHRRMVAGIRYPLPPGHYKVQPALTRPKNLAATCSRLRLVAAVVPPVD
jgi:hypothetical protein